MFFFSHAQNFIALKCDDFHCVHVGQTHSSFDRIFPEVVCVPKYSNVLVLYKLLNQLFALMTVCSKIFYTLKLLHLLKY